MGPVNAEQEPVGPGVTVDYDATAEVRFAVVLYGGVSLAIYMNGIVSELYSMVRATAPAPEDPDALHVGVDSPEPLHGAEPAYRELAQRLDRSRIAHPAGGPVKTRFVVDILTGASAGGINGIYLAKALANDATIDGLTKLWIDEGDLTKLINDKQAVGDLNGVAPEKPPQALLSGQRMLYKLLAALDAVSGTARAQCSPYMNELDLWITTTDLLGREQIVPTSEQARLGTVREVDHRTRLHFRYANAPRDENADGGADDVPETSMFDRKFDPILAFAARATSSFPGAFRACQPSDVREVVAGYSGSAITNPAVWSGMDSHEAATVLSQYAGPDDFLSRSFADGGYLDNHPVDLVMQTLPKRRSELPVSRRVLFVDPDPGKEPPADSTVPGAVEARDRVDLISTLLKVVTLPRVQTIGDEVARIEALSVPLRTRREIYAAVDAFTSPGTARTADDPARAGYLAMRVAKTFDDIADALTRVGFSAHAYDEDSAEYQLVREMLRPRWEDIKGSAQEQTARRRELLEGLDVGYVLRYIAFVKRDVDEIMRAADVPVERFERSRRLRNALDRVRNELVLRTRPLRNREPGPAGTPGLRRALDALGRAARPERSDGPVRPADAAARRDRLEAATRAAADAAQSVIEGFIDTLRLPDFEHAVDDLAAGFADGQPDLADPLRRWQNFEAFDEATLALQELLPGENDDIAVVRVSPRDAQAVRKDTPDVPKLAGAAIHHFGAFFSADWRRNDIMWGRLDAAERLITLLWPEDASDAERVALIRAAHEGIIGDLLRDDAYRRLFEVTAFGAPAIAEGDSKTIRKEKKKEQRAQLREDRKRARHAAVALPARTPAAVIDGLHENYTPPPGPSRDKLVEIATRAARVTDAAAAGLGQSTGPLQTLRSWLGVVLRAVAQFGEMVLDRTLSSFVRRRLLDLGIYAAILMIVVGAVFGGKPVVTFGWTLLAIAAGLKLLLGVARQWVADKGRWWVPLAVVVVTLTLVGLEGLLLSAGASQRIGEFVLGIAAGFLLSAQQLAAVSRSLPQGFERKRGTLAIMVAFALIAGCAGFGVYKIVDGGTSKLCAQTSWVHSVINGLPGVDCPKVASTDARS